MYVGRSAQTPGKALCMCYASRSGQGPNQRREKAQKDPEGSDLGVVVGEGWGLRRMGFHQGMQVGTSAQPRTRPTVPGEQGSGAGATGTAGGGYLAVAADGLPALLAGAGVEGLEAGHAVGALLPQDVLLAEERLFAMVAVKALHSDTRSSTAYRTEEDTVLQ